MKPLGKVNCTWSANLAYVIGLIATDGCLYSDGRHISLTSKDLEQIETFAKILCLTNKIGIKYSSKERDVEYFHLQFGDVIFYRFLETIGLTARKTKTIGRLVIPERYFRDFLRGHLDGDGCTYSYYDPRWKSSFMLYTNFISASEKHLYWLREKILNDCNIIGGISLGNRVFRLRYAKYASIKLFNYIYYQDKLPCLERKRKKFFDAVTTASLASAVK